MVKRLFELFDRLAGKWLDWHTDYTAKHNPEVAQMMAEFGLRRYDADAGEMTFVTPAALVIADALADMLDEANAENYVQLDVLPRLDRGKRPIRVTVQWAVGKSPAQKNAELVDEVEKLRKQIAGAGDE